VDYKVFGWEYRELCREHITPERIAEAAREVHATHSQTGKLCSATDVIVDLSFMHYGMQEKNPMHSIKFYSKNNPNQCSIPESGDISLLMPAVFAEFLLRVYTKDVQYFGLIQAAYRKVLQTMPVPHERDGEATEGPSTPRAHSRNLSFGSISLPDTVTREPSPKPGMTPFSDNKYTTVPVNHVPSSPTQKRGVSKSKREREIIGEDFGARPVKKKRAT